MVNNQIGLIKESYPLIKEICSDVYAALSLVFPQLPAYVTARRAECLVAACKATQEKLKSAGITRESQRACTLKLGLPWLEWVSLEEDSSLRDLWANLLANEINPDKPEPRTAFLSILRDLSPLDAQILNTVYEEVKRLTDKTSHGQYVPTPLVIFFDINEISRILDAEYFDIRVSVQNLKRCSLISDLPIMQKIMPPEAKPITSAPTARVSFQNNAIVPPDPNKFKLTELGCLFLDTCVADAGQTT